MNVYVFYAHRYNFRQTEYVIRRTNEARRMLAHRLTPFLKARLYGELTLMTPSGCASK